MCCLGAVLQILTEFLLDSDFLLDATEVRTQHGNVIKETAEQPNQNTHLLLSKKNPLKMKVGLARPQVL